MYIVSLIASPRPAFRSEILPLVNYGHDHMRKLTGPSPLSVLQAAK